MALPAQLAVKVLYASTTGTAARFAEELRREAFAMNVSGFHLKLDAVNAAVFPPEDIESETLLVVLLPTWTGGAPPAAAAALCAHVREMATDFRVSKDALARLRYAVFGLGNAEFARDWCRAATQLAEDLHKLGAQALCPVGRGDDSQDMDAQFEAWRASLWPALCELYAAEHGSPAASADEAAPAAGGGCCKASTGAACSCGGGGGGGAATSAGAALAAATPILRRRELQKLRLGMSAEERAQFDAARRGVLEASARARGRLDAAASVAGADDDDDDEAAAAAPNDEDALNDELLLDVGALPPAASAAGRMRAGSAGEPLTDVEDMGGALQAAVETAERERAAIASGAAPREMLTPAQRRALGKEGYQLIGSHSAVKICRWTKAMIRGRGGCYKHSFYGIASHRCMEATPSLACASGCTFCWRHHKNPVGREWRWAIDAPEMIVEQAIAKHLHQINMLKALPGLVPARYAEAQTVRHCALSLVGEPIMYPRINELVRLLHARRISTFLVTNAQFPAAMLALPPVTQLYVSIDAATRETLKAIDRPLFADFWERFLAALDALRARRQRTVYRLTLVKGKNMGELDAYATLVARGAPDFIEIKGVTWSGESPGSDLTMANVPWHTEVREFAELLCARVSGGAGGGGAGGGPAYGLAAEHAHSCCVLLAREEFREPDGGWRTHIDYEAFFERFARWEASGGVDAFASADYSARTPDWALYSTHGDASAGFDPSQVRWYRNKPGKDGGAGAEAAGGAAVEPYEASESGCG